MGLSSPESDKSGLVLSDFGMSGEWRASSESDRNGLFLSDFEDGGACSPRGWTGVG